LPPDPAQGFLRCFQSFEPHGKFSAFIFGFAYPKPECNNPLLASGKSERNLNDGTRIKANAVSARKTAAAHGRRIVQRAIAAQKLSAVAAHRFDDVVCAKKCCSTRKLRIVGIAGKNCPAHLVNFCGYVHACFFR